MTAATFQGAPLSALAGDVLEWRQPHGFRSQYELEARDRCVATLSSVGFAQRRMIAESSEGRWLLQRPRLWTRRVVIHDLASNTEVAHYQGRWGGDGTLEFPDGRTFIWRHHGIMGRVHAFELENGDPVVTVARQIAFLRSRGTVQIAPAESRTRGLMVMVVLGWYLVLRRKHASGH